MASHKQKSPAWVLIGTAWRKIGRQEQYEDFNPQLNDSESARLSLEDDGQHVHCSVCGDLFIMDDSDLCRHLITPLFQELTQEERP